MKGLIRVFKAIISILQQPKLVRFKGQDLQGIEDKLKSYYQSSASDNYMKISWHCLPGRSYLIGMI